VIAFDAPADSAFTRLAGDTAFAPSWRRSSALAGRFPTARRPSSYPSGILSPKEWRTTREPGRSSSAACTNGITATDDGRRLFVAHGEGIDRIDLPSHRRTRIAGPDSLNLGGADGLAFYRNSLIAHQAFGFNRVIRFHLSRNQDRVERADILDRHHPRFDFPTTGEVAAAPTTTSPTPSSARSGTTRFLPWEELHPVLILKSELR